MSEESNYTNSDNESNEQSEEEENSNEKSDEDSNEIKSNNSDDQNSNNSYKKKSKHVKFESNKLSEIIENKFSITPKGSSLNTISFGNKKNINDNQKNNIKKNPLLALISINSQLDKIGQAFNSNIFTNSKPTPNISKQITPIRSHNYNKSEKEVVLLEKKPIIQNIQKLEIVRIPNEIQVLKEKDEMKQCREESIIIQGSHSNVDIIKKSKTPPISQFNSNIEKPIINTVQHKENKSYLRTINDLYKNSSAVEFNNKLKINQINKEDYTLSKSKGFYYKKDYLKDHNDIELEKETLRLNNKKQLDELKPKDISDAMRILMN